MGFIRCNEGTGGGSGVSYDFIGLNQYAVMTGDIKNSSATGNEVYDYTVGSDIAGTFGTHNHCIVVNVKGHTSADVTTGSRYDGAFGIGNGVVYTTSVTGTTQAGAGTFTIDVSSYDYLVLVTGSYQGRKIVVTN